MLIWCVGWGSEARSLNKGNSYLHSQLEANSTSLFAFSIPVSNRSPNEVWFWTSFGLLFGTTKSLLNWESKPKLKRQMKKASLTFISRPIDNANRSLLTIEKANRSLLCLWTCLSLFPFVRLCLNHNHLCECVIWIVIYEGIIFI